MSCSLVNCERLRDSILELARDQREVLLLTFVHVEAIPFENRRTGTSGYASAIREFWVLILASRFPPGNILFAILDVVSRRQPDYLQH